MLAVLGPLLVLALSFRWLVDWHDEEDATAARNAGRIFNAKVLDDSDTAAAMDRLLANRHPDVIVLGPSYANTDIRPDVLAARLGVPRDTIGMLSVPNSVGAHWYAVLKYRVFEAGYHPKLIVVVSGLQSMLLTTPLSESSFVNLEVQLPASGDPVIDARVDHPSSLWWAMLREQRGKVRGALFDGLRDGPVTALLPVNRGQVRAALNRVFDDSRIDMRLHGASTPVVEATRGAERYYTADLLPAPEDSFLADVTRLVGDHGARIVWVRPPMSPHIPDELDDVVLPGVQERAISVVEGAGGAFVDMRAVPMTTAMFKNEDHMNAEGSRRFTEALANALLELDALHPATGPGGLPPLDVTTTGVDAAGQIAPGTTATWTVAHWEPIRGTFAADVLLEADALDGVGVRVAGTAVSLTLSQGRRVLGAGATGDLPAPPGAFEISVTVPPNRPPVRVSALALGRKLRRTFLVGDAGALQGRTVRLLGVTRVEAGVLIDESIHPTYAGPPSRVPGHDRPFTDLEDEIAAFETDRWAFLSDEALQGSASFGSRCSPLRITEDGVELPFANVPCTDVKRNGRGRSCHTTDRIFFGSSDGTDPARNGRTYRLVLDEGRRCDGAAWVYPIDRFTLAFPTERVAELQDGARWLTLGAKYLNFRPSDLVVRLRVDGELRIDTRFDGRELKTGPKIWALDPPIPPTATDVVLEVENKGHVFYLVTEATLSER